MKKQLGFSAVCAVLVMAITMVTYNAFHKPLATETGQYIELPGQSLPLEATQPEWPVDDTQIMVDFSGSVRPEQAAALLHEAIDGEGLFTGLSVSIPADYQLEIAATGGENIAQLAKNIPDLAGVGDALNLAKGTNIKLLCATGDEALSLKLIRISLGPLDIPLPSAVDLTPYITEQLPEDCMVTMFYAKDGLIYFEGKKMF